MDRVHGHGAPDPASGTLTLAEFRVLVVDDEEGMLEVCSDSLERLAGVTTTTATNPAQALELLKSARFDLLVTDIQMPGATGIELLSAGRQHDPELPVVIMTGFPSVETAAEAIRLGAVDYITKPFNPDDLMRIAQRLLENRRLQAENQLLKRRLSGPESIRMVGSSPELRQVMETIQRIAPTDVDVLLHGETGTGKELVARAIHDHSERAQANFVPVNCGAIPENLLESEFFGYEKGAFTGADRRSIGLLEYADGGTLFLDEVIDLPRQMQVKLLRVLQERRIRRLGGRDEIAVDIRVIAASAVDPAEAVASGHFREDLYYRINVVRIQVPPLRQRRSDIPELADLFRQRYAQDMDKDISGFAPDALGLLQAYDWPGNIRQLQNAVRRAVAMCDGDRIQATDLPGNLSTPTLPADLDASDDFHAARDAYVAQFEKAFVSNLLRRHHGDVKAAARAGGIPRGSFYRILKRLDMDPDEFRTT